MMDNKFTFGIPENALDKIKGIFKMHPKISKVWLYGSRALGTYRLEDQTLIYALKAHY